MCKVPKATQSEFGLFLGSYHIGLLVVGRNSKIVQQVFSIAVKYCTHEVLLESLSSHRQISYVINNLTLDTGTFQKLLLHKSAVPAERNILLWQKRITEPTDSNFSSELSRVPWDRSEWLPICLAGRSTIVWFLVFPFFFLYECGTIYF